LTDEKGFVNFINWNKQLDMEIDAGSITNADLIPDLAAFEGSLMYQLQKKSVKSDKQPESTYTLLFVAWKYKGYEKFQAVVKLIEFDERICWNVYKLKEYYRRYVNQLSTYTGSIKDT
jgi:hypothetical protein